MLSNESSTLWLESLHHHFGILQETFLLLFFALFSKKTLTASLQRYFLKRREKDAC